MHRSAKLREYVVIEGKTPTPESLISVAKTFQKAGEAEKAEQYLGEAQEAYDQLADKATDAEQKDALLAKVRSLRVERIDLLVDQGRYDEAIGELEVLLVPDESKRQQVLDRLGKDDKISSVELTGLLEIMSRNRRVMDVLSRAYLEARGSKERLLRCVNLCAILRYAHPKDDRHDEAWVQYTLRLARSYYQFGLDYKSPDAFSNVRVIIQNGIVTPGLLDDYDETVPGSKKQFEEMLAESKRRQ